jgi:hypothetical protein
MKNLPALASFIAVVSLSSTIAFAQEAIGDYTDSDKTIVYSEDFSKTANKFCLGAFESTASKFSLNKGFYHIECSKAEGVTCWGQLDFLDMTKVVEYSVKGFMRGMAGLSFAFGKEHQKGYCLQINSSHRYKILVGGQVVVEWTDIGGNSPENGRYDIVVRDIGSRVFWFINGQFITSLRKKVSDDSNGNRVFVGTIANGETYFDDVKVSYLKELPVKSFEPIIEMGEIFPAYLIATAAQKFETVEDVKIGAYEYLGDNNSQIGIVMKNSFRANAKITLLISCPEIMEDSYYRGVLDERLRQYEIFPVIKYKYRMIEQNKKEKPVWISYKLWVDDKFIEERVVNTKLHKIFDLPYFFQHRRGGEQDLRYLFSAFVDPDNEFITHKLLPEIKTTNKEVDLSDRILMPFELFKYLRKNGYTYSSVVGLQDSPRVSYQMVRTLDETVATKQANCIDGVALFCSVLYRLGVQPYVVLQPGHSYIGWYSEEPTEEELVTYNYDKMYFLETTMLQSKPDYALIKALFKGNQIFEKSLKIFKKKMSPEDFDSFLVFLAASMQGRLNLLEAQQKIADNPELANGYQIINITESKKQGVSSIGGF